MLGRSWAVAHRVRRRNSAAVLFLGIGLSLASSQCITEDGRCSKNQVPSEGELASCECAPGYVLDKDGVHCVACGAHSKPEGGKCVCEPGYDREDDDAPCEKVEGSAAGSACSEAHPCTDPNPYCAGADGEGYCTQSGCERNGDCPEKWLCAADGDESYCRKPPTGLGDTCMSSADCAGNEAKYCESFMLKQCMVNECAEDASICPSGFVCCDLRAVINESLCLSMAFLTSGMCPGGGKLVLP